MISRSPRDKEEDLVTLGSEEEFQTIDLYIKAEGIIASAFYLVSPHPLLGCESKRTLPSEIVSQWRIGNREPASEALELRLFEGYG